MKKMIIKKTCFLSVLVLLVSIPSFADVFIDETNFPDANFREYLLTNTDPICSIENGILVRESGLNGYGQDGILTDEELFYISGIHLENVKNLEGIKLLKNLHYLKCTGITTSKVDLSSLPLYEVDLQGDFKTLILPKQETVSNPSNPGHTYTKSPELFVLKIDAPILSLDLSELRRLEILHLNNTKLKNINLSNLNQGTLISKKFIAIRNPQEQFVLTPPRDGKDVSIEITNSNETNLDFSNYNTLKSLFIKGNKFLTSLTLPTDKTQLIDLVVHDNTKLNSLNVDDYTNLEALSYSGNGFKSVSVTKNESLRFLECYGNGLTSLDLSNNKVLNHLFCQNNLLTSLDLSNNTDLRTLECDNNLLTELNLSNNTYLRTDAIETLNDGYVTRGFPDNYRSFNWTWFRFVVGAWDGVNVSGFIPNSDYALLLFVKSTDYMDFIGIQNPSISLSPQSISKDYVAIDSRSKLGVQCNTNDGVLTSYGNYTAMTSSDDNNNYIVVGDGTTDVHGYNNPLSYNYNTGYTGDYDEAKTMAVNIGTSAHGMYVHPETLRGSDNFYSGTLYLEFPAKIPEGVQCYYAKGLDANEDLVGLTEVTGTIPANTAVIVKAPSEYKFFAFNESDETPAAPTDNIIEGTIEGLSVTPGTVLTLGHNVDRSTGEYDNFGFWNYRGNKISPFRAYIPKANLSAGAKNGFSLLFPEDGTTGIAHMANSSAAEEGAWYTLSGTRISGKPTTKGIYVNKGQKVVIR